MKLRLRSTLRAWVRYLNTCRPAAYIALLLVLLVTVCTAARIVFDAGAAHALQTCRVYANEPVRLVYDGRVFAR